MDANYKARIYKNRLDYIDVAKGIGIVLVVTSHSVSWQFVLPFIGFFVPVFYVTAGCTLRDLSLKKKAKRLLKPYFVISFFLLFAVLISGFREIGWEQFFGIFYSRYAVYPLDRADNLLLMTFGNSPMWFLTSLFTAFFAVYPLIRLQRWTGWLLGLYFVLTVLLDKLPVLLPWSIDTAFLMAHLIYTGMWMQKQGLFERSGWCWLLVLIIYGVAWLIGGKYQNLSLRDYGTSAFWTVVMGISGSAVAIKCCQWIARNMNLVKRVFVEIGQNSLLIFCIQMPLLQIARQMWYITVGDGSIVFCALFQIVFTLIVGWALSKLQQRYFSWLL